MPIYLEKELVWCQKATDCDGSTAQWLFGVAHEDGEFGLESNEETALMWHQKTADGGDAEAQRRLGCAYEDGDLGLESDLEKALMLLKMADETERSERESRSSTAGTSTSRRRSRGFRRLMKPSAAS